jgi:hypothetical protein
MLKIIATKSEGELYGVLRKERPENFGKVLDCPLDEAQVMAENISIFGDKSSYLLRVRIGIRNVVNEDDAKYVNYKFLESLHNSEHLFFLHGYGAEFTKLCETVIKENKDLKSVKIFKIEEVAVNDFPAELVTAIQKHDKKNSWDLLLKELAGKDAEPIHGSCVFAYKTLLVYMNDIKKNSVNSGVKDFSWNQAKRNAVAGKRERGEVVDKYFDLVVAYHEARLGQLDLAKKLEMWVLEK